MCPSNIKHSTTSPVAKIPHDVLLEIFTHCLPRRPMGTQESNTTIAPIILCHICSSWRRVALASPMLWSHLFFDLTVRPIDQELGGWTFVQKEIEHILWWKKNQGSIAPFLCMDLFRDLSVFDRKSLLAGDGWSFLLKYLSSAQYLQISESVWVLLEERLANGYQLICPNMHTLVTTNQDAYENGFEITHAFYRAQILIGLIPNDRPSALRRVSIYKHDLPTTTNIIPIHWSSLTHLSLHNVGISLRFWFPLIRAVPDLQWAFIYFNEIFDIDADLTPNEHILPCLSTLFVGLMRYGSKAHFRPSLLLNHLRLPALRTLALSFFEMDDEHIPEIYTILRFTPALTTLTIKEYDTLADGTYRPEMQASAEGDIAPIWSRTPHLTHVQLALPRTMGCSHEETASLLEGFARHAFFGATSLLGIDDPRCPLCTITLIDTESRTTLRFHEIEKLMRTCIQHCGGEPSTIVFKFVTRVADMSFEEPEIPRWKFWSLWYPDYHQ